MKRGRKKDEHNGNWLYKVMMNVKKTLNTQLVNNIAHRKQIELELTKVNEALKKYKD